MIIKFYDENDPSVFFMMEMSQPLLDLAQEQNPELKIPEDVEKLVADFPSALPPGFKWVTEFSR